MKPLAQPKLRARLKVTRMKDRLKHPVARAPKLRGNVMPTWKK